MDLLLAHNDGTPSLDDQLDPRSTAGEVRPAATQASKYLASITANANDRARQRWSILVPEGAGRAAPRGAGPCRDAVAAPGRTEGRNSMTQHLLLIGTSRDLHPKAHRLGARLTVLERTSKLSGRKLDVYSRIIGIPDGASTSEWVEQAALVHRRDPFTALGAFTESAEEQAAAVAAALGLPYHPAAVIQRTHDKLEMRRVLREAGLDDTGSRVVDSRQALEDFAAEAGYPIILKPLDARGSLGVSALRSPADVPGALDWFSKWASEYRMLAEELLQGTEWSVEAFSEGGEHRIVCITQKFKEEGHFVEVGHCAPAPLPAGDARAIEDFVRRVLSALGVQRGPSHTEVFLTAQGPRVVETHTRLGGDSIGDLIRLTTGVDLDELWIRQCLGESVLAEVPVVSSDKHAAIAFVSPHAHGTLLRVEGEDEVSAMPGVDKVDVMLSPGTTLAGLHDSFSRGASVIATGATAEEAVTRAQSAAGRLRFIVSCGGQ
jgi:biotin carboxylase